MPVEYANEAVGPYKLYRRELEWQRAGRQQTASGYGNRLTTSIMLKFDGENRLRRVYCVCHSNCGSLYIFYHGRKLYLPTHFQDEVLA